MTKGWTMARRDDDPSKDRRVWPLGLWLAIVIVLFGGLSPREAQAIPSFARQTGQVCASCHTAFPELTPFGRRFKLNGYTTGGGDSKIPPVAAMIIPTFTNTRKGRDDVNFTQRLDDPYLPTGINPPPYNTQFGANNNLSMQQASLFYGGQIYGNLGAFVQVTYDSAGKGLALDNTDFRYADSVKLLGQDFVWGISANNVPSVQDVWNTTPAWGFPYVSSTLAPEFSPPGTLIEGPAFAGQVAGAGPYVFINDMIYLEVSAYKGLPHQTQSALGTGACGPGTATLGFPFACSYGMGNGFGDRLNGAMPYWRAAIEPQWGNNSWEFGTFGLLANVYPSRDTTFGSNRYLDIGFDTQYQYINEEHAITAKATYIFEKQRTNANYISAIVNGLPTFPDGTPYSPYRGDSLRSFKASLGYVYDRTYSVTAQYFNVTGKADFTAYGGAWGSPNGSGFVIDLAYLPFSKGGPSFWPWLNMRLGINYTHYFKINGGANNFDCSVYNPAAPCLNTYSNGIPYWAGHNAKSNDTLFAYAWIAF
jgi:hypothetical protein